MTASTKADVAAFLRDHISKRTRTPPEQISGSTVLVDTGLESIDAVLISGHVEDAFGIEVEPSLMFEFQTLDEVADAVFALIRAR
ncbi:MAG TPA: acyl carrier protein [Brevundimonas sp.]|jgi:acyl carrier protein|uniref:acyl carrier protein n=1 Tax=Brevundimonas sp. TaxID=1871086 RepID=UPI002DE7688E|nr:acyl carrier protein [Brevundimonas sp.]